MSEYFTVNKDRTITIPAGAEVIGIENDHNCNRVPFKCPRYCDGYDLTQCTQHFVNFINLHAETQGRHSITDITVDADDDTMINFSWLISSIATSAAGEVAFSLCFNIIDAENNIEYEWNSAYTGGLVVKEGLFVTGGDAAYSTANYPVGAVLLIMKEHVYDPAEKYGGLWINYGLRRLSAIEVEEAEDSSAVEESEAAETDEIVEDTDESGADEDKNIDVYVYVRVS